MDLSSRRNFRISYKLANSINSKLELISYLPASELLNHISTGGADLSKVKKIVSNLREEDNPVVLIAVPK